MSVPIDLMYDYIAGYVNHDVIIYRWTPPGSKNIGDLLPLKPYQRPRFDHRPVMVCHDQEPLQWHLYNNEIMRDWVQEDFYRYWNVKPAQQSWPWDENHVLQSWVQPNEIANTNQRLILLHSEQHSQELDRALELGWLPVHLWSHGLIAQDWFRYARHDRSLDHRDSAGKTFLIYCRAWTGSREYRLWFMDQIAQRGLADHCTVRFGSWDQDHFYQTHKFKDQSWHCDPQWPGEIFCANHSGADASATYDVLDYQTHDVELVLETVVDRTHLTEKTCRAIACGKPFVLAAGPHALDYLKSYGFKSFHPWINESYDREPSSKKRLNMVLDEMSRISAMDQTMRRDWLAAIQSIAQDNRRHFSSDRFLGLIMSDFAQGFQEAVMDLRADQHQSSHWQTYLHRNYPDVSNLLGRV
jgi:hypothetical protein